MFKAAAALLLFTAHIACGQVDKQTFKRYSEPFSRATHTRSEAERAMQRLKDARTMFWSLDAADPAFVAAKAEYDEALLFKDFFLVEMDIVEDIDTRAELHGNFTKAGHVLLGNLDRGVQFLARPEFGKWSSQMKMWSRAKAKNDPDLPEVEAAMFKAWDAYFPRRDIAEYLFENPRSPLKSSDPRELFAALWLAYDEAPSMAAARNDVKALEDKYGQPLFTKLAEALPILFKVHPRNVTSADGDPTEQIVNHGFREHLDAISTDVDGAVATMKARTDMRAVMTREDAALKEAIDVMDKAASRGMYHREISAMAFVSMKWTNGRFRTGPWAREVPYEALFARYQARLCKEYAISSLRLPGQQAAKSKLEQLLAFISLDSAPKPTPEGQPKLEGPFAIVRDLLPDLVCPIEIGNTGNAADLVNQLEEQYKRKQIEIQSVKNARLALDRAIAQHRKWLEDGGPELASQLQAFDAAHKIYTEQFSFIPTTPLPTSTPPKTPPQPKRK